jgi:DNA-binding NtrC family response regulator
MNKLLKTRGARAATAPTPGATHRSRRILVVDDDTDIRQLGTEVLVRHGYQVDAAEDHTAGWNALQARTYDLLITDLDMPKLSGLKLVKRLRAAHLALPVILASGIMTPQELNRNPWFHLSGALLKPVSPDQLLQTVQAVVSAPAGAREQIAPPPNWRSEPSANDLRL